MYGGQNVSQSQYDELKYDEKVIGNAMADAFKTPEGYVMKNDVTVGNTLQTTEGDTVHVLAVDPNTRNIKVKVINSNENIEYYGKMGIDMSKPLIITWSPVQFDSIVGY